MPVLLVALTALVVGFSYLSPPPADAAGYPIGGKILEEYNQAGGNAFFGDAITREADAARGGKFQKFYKNNSIYWHPLVSNGHAQQIGGAIRDKWGELNWENGSLRYPTTRENSTRASGGKFNHFEGGSIYYSAATGTHPVWGEIKNKWSSLDWEAGPLGFPTSDEYNVQKNGKAQNFQGGRVFWSPNTGAHVVWGLIGSHYENAGFEAGKYGFPTSDEYADTGYEKGRRQNFENGQIQMADMTVPLSGYSDGEPPVDARRAPRAPDQSSPSPTPGPETSPPSSEVPGGQSEDSSPSPQPSLPGYSNPPSSSTTAVPASAAFQPSQQGAGPAFPAFQYGSPGGGFVAQPATWPFGDFCIFGTQDGPGSACRMNGDNPWQMTMCVAAIVVEAASLIFTASKILKIRSFIKSLGGAKEAFQLWRGASTKADRAAAWAKTGEITKELAAEFLGLATIAKFCG